MEIEWSRESKHLRQSSPSQEPTGLGQRALRNAGVRVQKKTWTTSFYDRTDPPGTAFAGATTVAADGDNLIISSGFADSGQVMDPGNGCDFAGHALRRRSRSS